MNKCPSCGELAVSSEGFGTEAGSDCQSVCTACGAVVEEACFTSAEPLNCDFVPNLVYKDFKQYGQNLPLKYVAVNDSERPPCPGFKECMKALDGFAVSLMLPPERKKAAQALFKDVFYNTDFKHYSIKNKIIMVGVCAYVTCRQNNVPITAVQMCQLIGCPTGDFVSWKRKIVSAFSIEISTASLEEMVQSQCQGYGLSQIAIAITEQLIQVCRSVWLVEGRKPQHIICAAAYLAWKAEEWATRLKIPLTQFCKKHRIADSAIVSLRVTEMTNVMISLARELPWVSQKSVNKKSFIIYIQDVIKYKTSLLTSALKRVKETDPADCQTEDAPEPGSEIISYKTSANCTEIKTSDSSLSNCNEKMAIKSDASEIKVGIVNMPNAGPKSATCSKRTALQCNETDVSRPPAFHIKRRKPDPSIRENEAKEVCHDLDCPDLGPDDMSDCELKMYV